MNVLKFCILIAITVGKFMYRRAFIKHTALGFITASGIIAWSCKNLPVTTPLIDRLIQSLDEQIPELLSSRIKDPTDPHFGGIPDAFQIYHAGSAAGLIQTLTTAYVSPLSKFFHDPALQQAMMEAIDFLLRYQHPDGSIDLLTTNFQSTPDTGFVVEPLSISYKLLALDLHGSHEMLRTRMKSFLTLAGEALTIGGIHTPNHRWVVCMALARLYDLFPDPRYQARINTWLAEGIDIDEDGQYTERSSSVYSPLTDRCLITIARLMNMPSLYDPVRRNLDMTLYYLHPNGEVVTEASRRQDQYQARNAAAYYYPYWYMSVHDQNGTYSGMKIAIEQHVGVKNLTGILPYLLEDEALGKNIPVDDLPLNYEKYFVASSLVRWRQGQTDVSMLAKNSTWFTLHHQHAVIQAIRLSTAFFGRGQFIPEEISKTSRGYRLTQKLEGPYFQPYPKDSLPGDGDWEKMPRDKRPKSEIQFLNYSVDLYFEDQNWNIEIDIDGTEDVPVAVELSFRAGGKLSNVEKTDESADVYLLSEGQATYTHQGSSIQFGPGKNEHRWTQLRGADPRIPGISVYLTGYTPFKHVLQIKVIN